MQAPLEFEDLSITTSLISQAGDWSIVFLPFTPKRGMKGLREQNVHKANSLQWAGLLTWCGATPLRQRPLWICVAGPSWENHLEECMPNTFPGQTELELSALEEQNIATQGFPFMICFSFKIKLSFICFIYAHLPQFLVLSIFLLKSFLVNFYILMSYLISLE